MTYQPRDLPGLPGRLAYSVWYSQEVLGVDAMAGLEHVGPSADELELEEGLEARMLSVVRSTGGEWTLERDLECKPDAWAYELALHPAKPGG